MLEALAMILLLWFVLDGVFGFAVLLGWLGPDEEDSKWDAERASPVDKVVVAVTAFGSTQDSLEGSVELHGARWNARPVDDKHDFAEGDKARVEEMDGLTLIVKALES